MIYLYCNGINQQAIHIIGNCMAPITLKGYFGQKNNLAITTVAV